MAILFKKLKPNQTTVYSYDALNRVIRVINDTQTDYVYDFFNRRIKKIQNEKVTRYLYQGQDEIGAVDENGVIQELRILGRGSHAEIGATVAVEL